MPDQEPHQEPQQKPKRRGPRVLAGVCIALAVVLALVVAAPMLVPQAVLGAIVAGRIEEQLGRDATVVGARFSYFSGLHARGLTVRRRAGFGDGALVRIERLDLGLGLSGLFGHRIELSRVAAEGVELALVVNEQGLLNVQDFFERPRSAWEVAVGAIAVRDATVSVSHEERGFGEEIAFQRIDASAVVAHKRSVQVAATLGRGGDATAVGAMSVTPDEGLFDHAELKVTLHAIAAGELAKGVRGKPFVLPELADVVLDGDFTLCLTADREGKADGTLTLRRLPAVPQLAFTRDEGAVAVKFAGEISPRVQHVELDLVTQPAQAVRLTARMDPIPGREGDPSFMIDRYAVAARLEAKADFAHGGLPGTTLATGTGTLTATAKFDVGHLAATLAATLDGGSVRTPEGGKAIVPTTASATKLMATGDFVQLARSLAAHYAGDKTPPAKLAVAVEADALNLDHLLAFVRRDVTPKLDEMALPECPPVVDATLEAVMGKVIYDGRAFEHLRLAGTLSGSVVKLAQIAANHGDGTVRGTARLAFGGDRRHALALDVTRLPLDQDFDLLERLPFLNIVNALVGGRPDHLSFLTTMKANFRAEGRTLDRLEATLTGKGDVLLGQMHFGSSPLFRDLAAFLRRPELGGTTVFARVDVPFTMADRRIESTATTPYKGGAFVTRGTSTFAGKIDYKMYVRNPKAIDDIPGDIAAYLEEGHPLVFITGTADAPKPRIPTEAIVEYAIKHKLKGGLWDKLNGRKP